MMNVLSKKMRSVLLGSVLAVVGVGQLSPVLFAADSPAEMEKQRVKFDNKISFYTQEEADSYSLRVMDRDATEQFKVKYTELWKYDLAEKRWKKMDAGAPAVTIVLAKQKGPEAPEDSQVIAELPVKTKEFGLYYAKWIVNDSVEGYTFCRVGPGLVGEAAKKFRDNPVKPQPGMVAQIVPLSLDKSEIMLIPDPRFNTGQPKKK